MTDTKPVILNYTNFEKVISDNKVVLVYFFAKWCVPCKIMVPILKEVGNELSGRVLIGKINVDDNRVLSAKYGVVNIPTMLLFNNGDKIYHFTGVQQKESIINIINKSTK